MSIGGGGEKLGGGYIALSADKARLVNDLAAAKGAVGGWFQSLQSYLAPIGLGLSLAAVWGTLTEAGQAADEAERSFNRLEAVVKATGVAAGYTAEELQAMATEFQNQIGYSDEALMDLMSNMLTFKSVQGDTFKRAIGLAADMSEVFGSGASSLDSYAKQLGKVLENPAKFMTALTRSGVTFTEAEQKKIKALQQSGNLLAAQKLILDAIAGQVGGAAAGAAKGPAGQLRIAREQLGDLKELLGKEIYPLQMLLVNGQKLWIQALTATLKVVNYIGPGIASWINPMTSFTGKMLAATAGAMALYRTIPMITSAIKIATKAIQLATISTGWGIVIVAIGLVVAALWQLVDVGMKSASWAAGWPLAAEKFRAAWIGAMEMVGAIWKTFAAIANAALEALGISGIRVSETIGGALVGIVQFLGEMALRTVVVAKTIAENGALAWNTFAAYADYALMRAADYVTGFFMFFVRTAKSAVQTIVEMFQEIPGVISAIFRGESVTDAVSQALSRVSKRFADRMKKDFAESMGESPEAAAKRKEAEKGFFKLAAEAMKNYMDLMNKARPKPGADDTTKKKAAAAAAAAEAAQPKFKSGIYGFEDYHKMLQEAFLKADDPTEKLVGLAEAGNVLQEQQLQELKEIKNKPAMEAATP